MIEAHRTATAGCMHEARLADVNASMRYGAAMAKKNQIAGPQITPWHGISGCLKQCTCRARQCQRQTMLEHVSDQSTAIEAGFRCVTAITIGRAHQR